MGWIGPWYRPICKVQVLESISTREKLYWNTSNFCMIKCLDLVGIYITGLTRTRNIHTDILLVCYWYNQFANLISRKQTALCITAVTYDLTRIAHLCCTLLTWTSITDAFNFNAAPLCVGHIHQLLTVTH